MKPSKLIHNAEPLSVAELSKNLTALEEQLARKHIERESTQETLTHAIVTHVGSDLGATERQRLSSLDGEIRQLELARSVLMRHVEEARKREAQLEFDRRMAESRRLAKALEQKASDLQAALTQVISLAAAVKEADAQFVDSLAGRHPNGFQPNNLSIGLMRRIETVLYTESNGSLRAHGFSIPPYELKQKGYSDLVQVADNYIALALSGRRLAIV